MKYSPRTVGDCSVAQVVSQRFRGDALPHVAALALMTVVVLLSGCENDGLPTPTLGGCPQQNVAPGASVTLTIFFDEGTLVSVTTTTVDLAEVVIAPVGSEFTAVVTPTDIGNVFVAMAIEYTNQNSENIQSISRICRFAVASTDLGACCESISCEVTNETECSFRDGTFLELGTSCNPNPCIGACCMAEQCADEFSEADCLEAGGSFRGSLSQCANLTCEAPGACCLGAGNCFEGTDRSCNAFSASSTFMGPGTFCKDFSCEGEVGACCISGGQCVEVSVESCLAQTPALSTSFQGVGRMCVDGNGGLLCDNPAGACCFSGTCQVLKEAQCIIIEGVYLGDNFLCRTPEVAAMCNP